MVGQSHGQGLLNVRQSSRCDCRRQWPVRPAPQRRGAVTDTMVSAMQTPSKVAALAVPAGTFEVRGPQGPIVALRFVGIKR